MPCRDLVEAVTAYLEGTLAESDVLRLEAHLATCAPCSIYIDQLRQTLVTVGRIEPEQLSPQMRTELAEAFRGWTPTS